MAKRKSDADAPVPHEKAKLHHQAIHDGLIPDTRTQHSPYSPPLSLASSERRGKRKRTPDSQSDTFEEPEMKRGRRCPSPSDSPGASSEPWPSIESKPRTEGEPCPVRQYINQMYIHAMQFHEEYDSDISTDHQNLPSSPGPSDDQSSNAHTLHNDTLHAPPLSLSSPQRREKRKRTLEYQFDTFEKPDDQSDTSEEPEMKRARRSPSPESPNTSSEPWPSIEYNPRKEEPNLWRQFCIQSYNHAMQFHEEYDSDISADCQNPLPSPGPSDEDASESNEWEFPTVDSIQARRSTPRSSGLLSRQRLRKRNRTPPQRKQRQPPKKGKGKDKRNKLQDETLSSAVETFLRSKRSSRRDPSCRLWQLGDDGMACTVSKMR